jgi:hypothetical protein
MRTARFAYTRRHESRPELLHCSKGDPMPSSKKTPAERISVTDQVGKRHVVVKYVALVDPGAASAERERMDEAETEYRLTTGASVNRTGAATFETADGRLRLKAL